MSNNCFQLGNFFDLSKTDFPQVYEDIAYPWEALQAIPEVVDQQLEPGIEGDMEPGSWIDDNVYIGPGTRVEPGARIKGPTIIGSDCEIRSGAYIRGNVIIGNGATIGNSSELKRALLHNQAEIPHFSYVGDSIIGWKGHLGAGVIASNLKITRQEIIVHAKGEHYKTGLRKFGCILGDRAEIGCNSVLNPGSVIGKGVLAMANTSLSGYYPPESFIKLRQETEVITR